MSAVVPFKLGALGVGTAPPAFTPVTAYKTAVGTAAGVGAGAVIAHLAVLGSAAGPVGTVVGAVVGLAAAALLSKNYLNVANVNADEDNSVAAFNQYRRVAGRAPGRQFGLAAMRYVWKGALFSGLFPKNNTRLCFHNGCLKYLGQPSEIDDVLDKSCGDQNCFNDVKQLWLASRSSAAPSASGGYSPPLYQRFAAAGGSFRGFGKLPVRCPRSMRAVLPPEMLRYSRDGFRGFGALGQSAPAQPADVPDAVVFIDQFFIPAQARCSASTGCGWAVPETAIAHQLLYDVADAWLAERAGVTTTPFIALAAPPAAAAPPLVASATSFPSVPTTVGYGPGQCPPGWYQPDPSHGCQQLPSVAAQPALQPGIPAAYDSQYGTAVYNYSPILAPVATPLVSATPPSIANSSQAATSVVAATSANLDAQLASQGFQRVGTTSAGFPIYAQGSQTFIYQNGGLYPYGTVAQLATTGNVGSGIGTPVTGLDPNTLATIANAIRDGLSQQQAAAAGAATLQAQGVPITPTVQDQLNAAASSPLVGGGISSNALLIGGGVLLLLLLRK